MSFSISATEHTVAFPSKLKSSLAGHIYNVILQEDLDNGRIRGLQNYTHFDQYEDKAAPTAFRGKVVDRAANGNYYVLVTAIDVNAPTVLIYDDPIIKETNDPNFKHPKYFYNAKGNTVRGFELSVGDIFELSESGFTNIADIDVTAKTLVKANATTGKLDKTTN